MVDPDIIECPPHPPKKRRQLEAALDKHIAIWLSGPLTPSERRRLEEEKQRRKDQKGAVSVGIVTSGVGVTPEQRMALRSLLGTSGATVIHKHQTSKNIHSEAKHLGVPVHVHATKDQIVRNSDRLIFLPHEHHVMPYATRNSVWYVIGKARSLDKEHIVVLPNGKEAPAP